MNKRSKTAISFFVLFILMMQSNCTVLNPPQDALRNLFKAIDKRDYNSAIQYCTGHMQDGYFMGQKLESWCMSDLEGDITIKILNVDVQEEDKAFIAFEVHLFTDESMKEIKLLANLVHRKGKWLVDDINEL
ncbi:hypothetical protein KKB99_01060 [bacterium]|nr:hypothetical protein [bacterium]MBU1024575.1 hypothetical protein [bacterium]